MCYKVLNFNNSIRIAAQPPGEVTIMKDIRFDNVKTDSDAQDTFFRAFMNSGQSPIKILLRIYKGNYFVLLKSVFYYIIQISPVIFLPIVTSNIINIATYPEQRDFSKLILNAAVMAVLIVQNILTTYLSTKNRSIANRRVELNLRSSMARKLQQLSIAFHKEMRSGRIQSKVMRDVENIESLTSNLFLNGISILVSLVTAISVTLSRSPIVFLFFLITVPCALIIMKVFSRKIQRSNAAYRSEVENASAQVMEMVELIPVTKAHALEETALGRMNQQLFRMADKAYQLDRITALFGSTYWVVFQMFQLICLVFTGILAFQKRIPIGDITLYQTYFSTIVSQISAIISLLPIISRGFESVRSVGEIMWAMDVEDDKDKKELEDLQGTYEFKDVCFHYPDDETPVLNHLNLTIHKGETVAFVGESGSGKTTLLNMLIGFYRPTSGTVFVDGQDMNEISLHSYRSHIATVPQTSVLFSGSIRDNITFGMENCTQQQLDNAIQIANLQDVIAKLPQGLDTKVGEHGDKLSGGQRQRIAIARAVIRDASVIIFDEATSALDSISERLIQDSLDRLGKDRTTFIVAHRLSTIRNADKIAVIKDGACVEYGSWDELMARKGEFYKFKEMQS